MKLKMFKKDLLDQLSLDIDSRLLGSGVHGTVFETKKGQVVKFTSFRKEAKIAKLFIGKRLPHVVRVYSVQKVPGRNLWAIRMEKLYPHKLCWAEGHTHTLKGLVSLARKGYYYWDLHNQNIMYDRRTKKYKLIDLASLRKGS